MNKTTPKDNTDWAIGEALASGTSPEQIAHNMHEQMSRAEAVRLIRQLLIDKHEHTADLHEDDDFVIRRLNKTITNLAVDVQTAIRNYMK